MRFFIQICSLFLPLFITADADNDVDRRATALEHISGVQESEGCTPTGKWCNKLWHNCCGNMKCLGVFNYACGHYPGKRGDLCDKTYPCEGHLVCHPAGDKDKCYGYEQILLHDKNLDKHRCRTASSPTELKVMSYNVFLIQCIEGFKYPCQHYSDQPERISRMMEWMKSRNEDVVMMQEIFGHRYSIILGMRNAGFCHYVATPYGITGSGLAIFSKHPIEKFGFLDWNDGFQANFEAVADKGVMYAKINNGGIISHIFNAHTQSDSRSDSHWLRMHQYLTMKKFARSYKIPSDQLILYGGDLNERRSVRDYYEDMLAQLEATDSPVSSHLKYSYDTHNNKFLKSFHHENYQQRLDYILKSNDGRHVCNTKCSILHPVSTSGCDKKECELSDHFPVTCAFQMDVHIPHMQIIVRKGNRDETYDLGEWAGTKIHGLLETFEIAHTGNVELEYYAHIQNVGDTAWQSSGFPGQKGANRRMEGFGIRLKGASRDKYTIKYKAHIQDFGDTKFVYDGAFCGFRGKSKRVEGIFIRILPKCIGSDFSTQNFSSGKDGHVQGIQDQNVNENRTVLRVGNHDN